MDEPYIGEIQMFAGNYAPEGWAFCNGQLLMISEYGALFSLLGWTYGGDGHTIFRLPDLRGRVAVGVGTGPGIEPVAPGEIWGTETVSLSLDMMPAHTHAAIGQLQVNVYATIQQGAVVSPAVGVLLCTGLDVEPNFEVANYVTSPGGTTINLGGTQIEGELEVHDTGSGLPHENMMPWQAVNYIIAIEGIYPPRS